MDWTIAALNRMTRRFGGVSNASQIVLELDNKDRQKGLPPKK